MVVGPFTKNSKIEDVIEELESELTENNDNLRIYRDGGFVYNFSCLGELNFYRHTELEYVNAIIHVYLKQDKE